MAGLLQDKRLTLIAEKWSWISNERICIFQKFVHFYISSEDIYDGTAVTKASGMRSLDDTLYKIMFSSQKLNLALENFLNVGDFVTNKFKVKQCTRFAFSFHA